MPPLDCPVTDNTIFVPENVFFSHEEDLALPEGKCGQPKQHRPCQTHHDSHDSVQDKEGWVLNRVSEDAQIRDPARVWKRQGPAYDGGRKKKYRRVRTIDIERINERKRREGGMLAS